MNAWFIGGRIRQCVSKNRSLLTATAAVTAGLLGRCALAGSTYNVTTSSGTGTGSLFSAITQADANGAGAMIVFQNGLGTINAGVLPPITAGMTISGGTGNTLSGQSTNRVFFVNAPSQSVTIESITLANGLAQGGAGATGGGAGGGGAGMGGAIFVNAGALNLQSVAFTGNAVIGGAGGGATYGGGGGGGGLHYAGGSGTGEFTVGSSSYYDASGGGGGALTSAGGTTGIFSPGNGGGVDGGGANSKATGPDGGGGGGTMDTSPYNGNGFLASAGGTAGDFGGGGGGGSSVNNSAGDGGTGGFGAGGGGGADGAGYAGNGGAGGFGGGGGGGGGSPYASEEGDSSGGTAGFLAGAGGYGNQGGGGGGAALGGAVFVRTGNGASISFIDTSIDQGSVTGGPSGYSALSGHSGSSGGTAGSALFLMGGTTTFSVSPGTTQTVAGSIAESGSSTVEITGGGTMLFSGDNQTTAGYSGGTLIEANTTLSISSDKNLGLLSGALSLDGGTLDVTGTTFRSTTRNIALNSSGGTIDVDSTSNLLTISSPITGAGSFTKSGAGTLALNAANTYQGTTNVAGGTLELGDSFNGTIATLLPTGSVFVINGSTLVLGSATGQTNVLGGSSNAPNVPIAPINISNGTLTTFAGNTQNVGYLYLADAKISGSSTTYTGYYDYTFNSPVTVDASAFTSVIDASGGIGLRIQIPFNVSSGIGILQVTAALHDEPGFSGGVTKNAPGTMILAGADDYSGGTIVNAGTLEIGAAGALPANSALTLNGGTVTFNNVTSGAPFVSVLNSLTLGGSLDAWAAKVDITNTDLVIHTGSLKTLDDQALAGLGGGTWNGPSGITSSAAAQDTHRLTAVGIIQNYQNGSALFNAGNPFDGTVPAVGDFLVKYTYYGDANLDGQVDGSDYTLIDNGFNNHLTGWINGDFNYDGKVDGSDYTLIDNAFNTQGAPVTGIDTAEIATADSAVPEPSLLMLASIAVGLLHRRRRRSFFTPNVV